MEEIFRKILDNNLADLQGLTVDASFPVPEYLINEIIASALRGNKDLTYCQVTVNRQNRVSANLKMPLLPWTVNLKLRLDESLDLTSSSKFKARLENNLLLARIGSFLKALPAGISIQGDRVVADIESFLSTPQQKRLLRLVRSVAIKTETSKMIFDVRIKVDDESH